MKRFWEGHRQKGGWGLAQQKGRGDRHIWSTLGHSRVQEETGALTAFAIHSEFWDKERYHERVAERQANKGNAPTEMLKGHLSTLSLNLPGLC